MTEIMRGEREKKKGLLNWKLKFLIKIEIDFFLLKNEP